MTATKTNFGISTSRTDSNLRTDARLRAEKMRSEAARKNKRENIIVAILGPIIVAVGVALLAALAFAPLALGIWALVFGISDWVNVGFNGWALAWTILGAALVLGWLRR